VLDERPFPLLRFDLRVCNMSATKAQSQKIFEKLKTKPANRVRTPILF
jgi:hypothetical protein